MPAWSPDELETFAAAREIDIAVRRSDGTLRTPVPVWVVRVGDELYLRSWRGTGGAWYRAVLARREGRIRAGGVERDVGLEDAPGLDDAVDAAYRDKYAGSGESLEQMITEPARGTTLRLVPRP